MKARTRRAAALTITALISLEGCSFLHTFPAAPAAKQVLDRKGLVRFERVDDNVYRGSQPLSATQLAALVNTYHFRSVLKLNGEDPEPRLRGVQLIPHPLYGLVIPTASAIKKILRDIEDAPKPLYIHCKHGEDRTGLIVALYRIRHGETAEAAYRDMRQNGFHPYKGLWRAWVRETGWIGKPEAGLSYLRAVHGPPEGQKSSNSIFPTSAS